MYFVPDIVLDAGGIAVSKAGLCLLRAYILLGDQMVNKIIKNLFLLMIKANNKEGTGTESAVNIVESLDEIASGNLLENVTFENEDFK